MGQHNILFKCLYWYSVRHLDLSVDWNNSFCLLRSYKHTESYFNLLKHSPIFMNIYRTGQSSQFMANNVVKIHSLAMNAK